MREFLCVEAEVDLKRVSSAHCLAIMVHLFNKLQIRGQQPIT